MLDAKIPQGVPLDDKWTDYKGHCKLVNPANKRKLEVLVVGTGLAGASAAASLGELGYRVKAFCYQDSPRRAHSIAAQGGINAAKNYQNDGDSVFRLFYDTIKGGDFRSREANVYRLAEVSANIIDQCVAQGVPFAREYSGYLANRSFGGAQVSRTFYARGQTGQQLLLGCYQALCRQIAAGTVEMFPQTEMLDLVIVDGQAKGIITRSLRSGKIDRHAADAVVLATGGYGNVFYLSTNARGCNVTATYRAYKRGALFANPAFTQIHPTCIPVTGGNAYKVPMRIYPAVHYTMGGLWVDYELMSNVPGLFVIGEANFSDHGANRLGASALMQGLADGYFVLPNTLPNYLAAQMGKRPSPDSPEFQEAEEDVRARIEKLLKVNGTRSLDSFHRELGLLLWDKCGMSRHEKGLREALEKIPELRKQFWREVRVLGSDEDFNQSLERAGRVADFLEFAELMCTDALERDESSGGHFREEHQTPDGEALRDDEHHAAVFAWEFQGDGQPPKLHREPLHFETVHLTQRSYK